VKTTGLETTGVARVVRMSDTTSEFFAELARHGQQRLPAPITASFRFDIEHDHEVEPWLVRLRAGKIEVARERQDADTVIHADRPTFERLVRGEVQPLEAWLRNEITAEGEFGLVALLERLFPATPGARHPRDVPRTGAPRNAGGRA
jgi:putative sterol carrier protein